MAKKNETYINVFGIVHVVEGDHQTVRDAIPEAKKLNVPVRYRQVDGAALWVNPDAVGSVWSYS